MKQHCRTMYRFLVFLLFFFLLMPSASVAEIDVTDQVELKQTKLVYLKNAQTSFILVGVKNISDNVLLAPIKVVIDDISPEGIVVLNPDGEMDGKPYLEYTPDNGELLIGESTSMKKLIFSNPNNDNISYSLSVFSSDEYSCRARVATGVWKEFDCYNLAAIGKVTGVNPFTPSWELNGGYWQWGRKGPDQDDPDDPDWYNTNTPNFAHGPTGPGVEEANEGAINGWDQTDVPDGAWSDSTKTENDPCPDGYRVPTKIQWDGVIANNEPKSIGTWSTTAYDHTNYSSARLFGNELMLPAAGSRLSNSGSLFTRGNYGYYWSSSESYSSNDAWNLYFGSGGAGTSNYYRLGGFSVRCVAE